LKDDLLQPVAVAEHLGQRAAELALHGDVFELQLVRRQRQRPADHVVQVHGNALRRSFAREGEAGCARCGSRARLLLNHLQVPAVFLAELFLLEQKLRQSGDRRERVVQLVGDTRDQLSDRGELLALYELRLQRLLLGLRLRSAPPRSAQTSRPG